MAIRFPLVCLVSLMGIRAIPTRADAPPSGVATPAAPANAPAPDGALSLDGALLAGRSGSFTLGSAQARIAAAGARLSAAGAFAGTTLTLARAFGSQNTAGFDEDVILSQIVELGKRGARVRGARADLEAANFDRAGVGTDLEFAIRSAYYDALRTDVELNLAMQSLARAQKFEAAAQTGFTAGDVPRANVVRAQVETSRAGSDVRTAQSERRIRLAALRSLLGMPDDAPLDTSDKLSFAPVKYDLPALIQRATDKRADVQSARATLRSKQASAQAARALSQPDVFIEARRAGIVAYNGLPNGTSVRVGITIPLFDFGRNRSGAAEARANVQDGQGTLNTALRTARLDVTTTYERLMAAQSAVQGFDQGRLARATELLDMAQTGYERGANSYLELLDAQSVYRTEQADYARALAAWNTALADLGRAVGGQLP